MIIVDLSHTLRDGMAVYPGDETTPEILRLSDHGPSSHRSSAFSTGCHAGTHMDLPLHFLAGAQAAEAYPLERCLGAAVVVDAPGDVIGPETLADVDLDDVDFVVFRTGWARHWGAPLYYERWPWLAPETTALLAAADLKGVGLDTPSLDPHGGHEAHDRLAAKGCINLENLANLDALVSPRFTLLALPLKLEGCEASPVRAVALLDGTA